MKRQLAAAHPIFGDRLNQLTLIGMPAACEHFAAALRDAWCTEREVAAWRRGRAFSDPWPKTVRKVS